MSVQELQEFTRISKYARYNAEAKRRETWNEQVSRVMTMHRNKLNGYYDVIEDDILFAEKLFKKKYVLGSQRALQFGGDPILQKNARLYKCSVTYIDRTRVFQEVMWMLLCGAGVGFSVQKHHIKSLPEVAKPNHKDVMMFEISDTIEGWSDAIGVLMSSYFVKNQPFPEYFGKHIEFDFSKIRKKGSTIKSTNAKAPGPKGLMSSIEKIREVLDNEIAGGMKKLRPIVAYDVIMHASAAVISGGIRRSATIALFSKTDEEMLMSKTGDWFTTNPQRGRSNNSVVLLRDETSKEEFDDIIQKVKQFGEPGFVWTDDLELLVNPCVEIGMYAKDENGNSGWQVCNLSEINGKKCKTKEEFLDASIAASILGTIQASYTSFSYLGEVSENIIKREALLGVSITGMMDNPEICFNPEILKEGARLVKETNKRLSKLIGINQAARTTCIKPAGTSSCILGSSSGIHPQHAKRYFRRVQSNKQEEPLKYFKKFNLNAVEESVWSANNTDDVITFLCEVPSGARTKKDTTAIDLLNAVKLTQQNWVLNGTNKSLCVKPWLTHNVSNTINVRPDEWNEVGDYIYSNRKYLCGISLLPMDGDKDYCQAPFTTVYNEDEIIKEYGSGSLFASGLIVHALEAFDGDLWAACSQALGTGETLFPNDDITKSDKLLKKWERSNNIAQKKEWVLRFQKFAGRYLDGDGRRATYLLKDVNNWKIWMDLKRTYVPVPWEDFNEEVDNTKLTDTVACGGNGAGCEITSF